MFLSILGAAWACTADEGMSLYATEYPVDAHLLLKGLWLRDVVVLDDAGAEVAVTLQEKCFDANNNAPGACRYTLAPSVDWIAGADYSVWVSYQAYAELRETTFEVTIAADGRRVQPVSGTPDLAVERIELESEGNVSNSCTPSDPTKYALRVTPAAPGDAEGLSYLQITRTDGYTRALSVPEDAAPFDVEFLAHGAEEHCFTIVQIDGAGNESESVEACVEEESLPVADASCGCAGSGSEMRWAPLMLGLAALRRRRSAGGPGLVHGGSS